MKALHDEICRRFPEIHQDLADRGENEPYTLMARVVEWLKGKPAAEITPEVIARIQAFACWCEEQPRGATAADDPLTILVVGFYERLLQAEHMLHLASAVISKEEFAANAAYLQDWIGPEKYAQATKHFRQDAVPPPQ